TTEIDYRANLASYPLTSGHDVNIPKSELLDPANFIANPLAGPPSAAKITGTGATLLPDAAAKVTGSTIVPTTLVNTGTVTINGTVVNFTAGMNHAAVLAAINGSVQTLTGTGGFTSGGTVGGAPAAITIQ